MSRSIPAVDVDRGLRSLRRDPLLGPVIRRVGRPALEPRTTPFFHDLARSVLYQQLSGAAATTIYRRLVGHFPGRSFPTPEQVAALTVDEFRPLGVSRQKATYLVDLARKYQDGTLRPRRFRHLDDDQLIAELTQVKGVGVWTAQMFLIFTLRRPDIWPRGDLGIQKGLQRLFELEDLPKGEEMDHLAERWRPYRSIACWYLWRLAEGQ